MIGPLYRGRAAQAVLGSTRSQVIPAVLWSGWLDASGDLIAMTGRSHRNDDAVFGLNGDVVTNVAVLDCGVAGSGWQIAALGLFDAKAGNLVVSAALNTLASPAAGEPLSFAVGALTFAVA